MCLLIIPDNSYKGALVYFMLAAVILVFSAIANWKFMQLPFVKYYIKKANEKSVLESNSELGPDADINKSPLLQRSTKDTNYLPPTEDSENQKPQKVSPLKAFLGQLVEGFKATWVYLSSLSVVFMFTFMIFPAVITDTSLNFLHGIENDSLRFSWTMLVFITCFNVFDTIGRWLAGQSYVKISDKCLIILTYGRIHFIFNAYLIDYVKGPDWLTGKGGDWFKMLNMTFFAFTNGKCATQCAIKASEKAPESLKEVVGTLIGISITLGIVVGSLIALGTASLVHNNPK